MRRGARSGSSGAGSARPGSVRRPSGGGRGDPSARAMRGFDRSRHSVRQRRWSWPRLFGRQRGRPWLRRTPGTTSRTAASMRLSCRLAPLSSKERRALCVDDEVALCARAPPVRGVRADLRARRRLPPFAGMDALSIEARLQSSSSAAARRSSSTRCSSPSTPAACQSRSRRQHVMPVQPNASRGSIAHGMPDRSTNTMPSRAVRSSQRGRPPFGFGGSAGSSGSTAAHNSSFTRGLIRGRFCYSLLFSTLRSYKWACARPRAEA